MSNLFYDDNWKISLSNLPGVDMGKYNGPFTGNGKIGFYTSMTDVSTTRTVLSANYTFNQIGKYQNNVIQGFDTNTIKFIHNNNSNITYNLEHQSLDMSRGVVETKFVVASNNIPTLTTQHRVIPLRQYPFCVIQSVEFQVYDDTSTLDIYHEVGGSPSFINEMNFNNNVIYNEKIYDDNGLYILNAEGNLNRLNNEGQAMKIACASCYLFDTDNEQFVKKLGFNVYNNMTKCYQKLRWSNLVSGTTYKFYVLSSQMSAYDFPTPLEEVKRILLNVAFKSQDTTIVTNIIASENLFYWNKLWESDILIEPKAGISTEESKDFSMVKQYLRYSMFNILACIRDGVNAEVNPLNLSYLDANGNIFFDGDLWMVPVLLLLKPDMAKTILENRYKNLEQATQLAASFGLKGSKFPYQDDIVGYTSVYWDVVSPLHVFNNAVIAINVWNFYRVSLDMEWLSNKGYIMMKNVADFICSIITIDDVGNYNIYNVAGMSERISLNPALTIYLFKLALKYIIEASYELNFIPKQTWKNAFLNLDITTNTGVPCGLIAYDDQYDGEDLDVLDHLTILLPYYSSMFFNPNKPCRDTQSILTNVQYYKDRLSTSFEKDPMNNLILANLYASVIQSDVTQIDNFYLALLKSLNENARDIWGFFNRISETQGNDVSLNALFIMMFLTGIGGLQIKGGVSEAKFYYEEFKVQGRYYANMPNTWKNIRLKGIGISQELFNVVNMRSYP
jgi:protein-glucosylgalactosylhydroxylysine glucosidase